MCENNNNNNDQASIQRMSFYQRRSVSAGDNPTRINPDDTPSAICNEEQTFNYNEHITKCDNGYICTPLPRTNHPPTAKTCWLVF